MTIVGGTGKIVKEKIDFKLFRPIPRTKKRILL